MGWLSSQGEGGEEVRQPDKHLQNLAVVQRLHCCCNGPVKWGCTHVVLNVGRGSVAQQQLHHVHPPVVHCPVQEAIALCITFINVARAFGLGLHPLAHMVHITLADPAEEVPRVVGRDGHAFTHPASRESEHVVRHPKTVDTCTQSTFVHSRFPKNQAEGSEWRTGQHAHCFSSFIIHRYVVQAHNRSAVRAVSWGHDQPIETLRFGGNSPLAVTPTSIALKRQFMGQIDKIDSSVAKLFGSFRQYNA